MSGLPLLSSLIRHIRSSVPSNCRMCGLPAVPRLNTPAVHWFSTSSLFTDSDCQHPIAVRSANASPASWAPHRLPHKSPHIHSLYDYNYTHFSLWGEHNHHLMSERSAGGYETPG